MSDATIFDLIGELSARIPDCVVVSVVDARDGMSLAAVSPTGADATGADAYQAELYRLIERAMEMLDRGRDLESIVLLSGELACLSAPIESEPYFWFVVTERATTVGFTQALMRKYSPRVAASVRALSI